MQYWRGRGQLAVGDTTANPSIVSGCDRRTTLIPVMKQFRKGANVKLVHGHLHVNGKLYDPDYHEPSGCDPAESAEPMDNARVVQNGTHPSETAWEECGAQFKRTGLPIWSKHHIVER